MNPALETLLRAAILAPSGDNTQPWRFTVDESESAIEIDLDTTRDPSPMNAGQRMSRIACGAALENIVRTAAYNRWPLALETNGEAALATVRLLDSIVRAGTIDAIVVGRTTNRLFYDAAPLDESLEDELRQLRTAHSDVQFYWVAERREIQQLARIVGEADAAMFGIESMRRAFLANIRFDLPADERATEGLPVGTLGLGKLERFGLRSLCYLPDPCVKFGGVLRGFRRRAAALVESASGVCAISTGGDTQEHDLAVGRAFQQAWLAFSAAGFAVQPMMSLPVLDGWQEHTAVFAEPGLSARVAALSQRAQAELKMPTGRRIAALIRFGRAAQPSTRTGRRVLRACVTARAGCDEQRTLTLTH